MATRQEFAAYESNRRANGSARALAAEQAGYSPADERYNALPAAVVNECARAAHRASGVDWMQARRPGRVLRAAEIRNGGDGFSELFGPYSASVALGIS